MKVPTGLISRKTFFEVPCDEDDDYDVASGPATYPEPSEGWWWSSEPRSRFQLGASPDAMYEARLGMASVPEWFMAPPFASGIHPSWICSGTEPAASYGPSRFDWLLAEANAQAAEKWLSNEITEEKPFSSALLQPDFSLPPGLLEGAFDVKHPAGEPARLPLRAECGQAAELLGAGHRAEAMAGTNPRNRGASHPHSLPAIPPSSGKTPTLPAEILAKSARDNGDQVANPAVATKGRRRRSAKEAEPCGRPMPTSMVIDLGGLVKLGKASK